MVIVDGQPVNASVTNSAIFAATLTQIQGTTGSPVLIATSGISILSNVVRQIQYIAGNGGPVTVTSNPQIQAGTINGQELELVGTDSTNTVTLSDGNGLKLNGNITVGQYTSIKLVWDGSIWREQIRNGL